MTSPAATASPLRSVTSVLGAAIGMYAGFAVQFIATAGVFLKPIAADFGWSRAQASLISTLAFLGMTCGAPVLGLLIDRLGPRLVLGCCILVFSSLMATLGFLPGHGLVFPIVSLLIGFFGAGTSPAGYVQVVTTAFDRRLGLALGCAMLGLGIGAITMPVIAQMLITALGWRQSYLVMAAGALGGGIVAHCLLFWGGAGRARPRGQEQLGGVAGITFRAAVATRQFWVIALILLVTGAAGFGAASHLPAALSDRGFDARTAAAAAGLYGAGVFIGRSGVAVLMDRIFAPLETIVAFCLGSLGLYILAVAPPGAVGLSFAGALLTGLLTGTDGDIMPILLRRYFGTASFGAIFGCVFAAGGFGGAIGPIVFGLIHDRVGDYGPILIAAAISCLGCAGLCLLLGRYPYPVRREEHQ